MGGYFPQLFDKEVPKVTSPKELPGADLLVMWGGADISPALYGETVHRAHASNQLSVRDKCEVNLVLAAKKFGIPILAICRGAQLVCAMGGGGLWQHVDNHEGLHHKIIIDGEEFDSNSAHHQVMIPTDAMTVIAYAKNRSPTKYRNSFVPVDDQDDEAEIVWMPEFNCLGIQGHPEWLTRSHDLVKVTRVLTKDFLNVTI
jgi:gamma-glutamyl-gamma-aminobutyrate hydrolase PuuD